MLLYVALSYECASPYFTERRLIHFSFAPTAGNKLFRDAVSSALHKYMQAESRFEKSLVVHDIVSVVERAGGRFLKKEHKTGTWYELSRQQSKEKVGHAIRDAVNSYESRAKKKQQRHHERVSVEHGYAALPSMDVGSNQKRLGTAVFDTDYSHGSRKRRRTLSPSMREHHFSGPTSPSGASLPCSMKQSPIVPPPIDTGLAALLPSGFKRSPILQNPQQNQFDYTGSEPGMVASLPSLLQPSPVSNPQRELHSSLDAEHHQRTESHPPISHSTSSGLHSPPEYLGQEQKFQHHLRDLPATLPLPPHSNIRARQQEFFHLQQQLQLLQPLDPQHNPLDPVARMQLMQMQQQRDQYFNDHPESRGDDNDHFLDAINAVLGPMPPEADSGTVMGPQQQLDPFLNPAEPQHPDHPQHQMWLQQRQQREALRRRQQEHYEEQQRRRRQHDQQQPE
jgi:hypothetical protein